MGIIGPYTRP
jgi:hypothetical protein